MKQPIYQDKQNIQMFLVLIFCLLIYSNPYQMLILMQEFQFLMVLLVLIGVKHLKQLQIKQMIIHGHLQLLKQLKLFTIKIYNQQSGLAYLFNKLSIVLAQMELNLHHIQHYNGYLRMVQIQILHMLMEIVNQQHKHIKFLQ